MRTFLVITSFLSLIVFISCGITEVEIISNYHIINKSSHAIKIEIFNANDTSFKAVQEIKNLDDTISFQIVESFEFFNVPNANNITMFFDDEKYLTYNCRYSFNTSTSTGISICNDEERTPLDPNNYSYDYSISNRDFYYYITEEDYNRAIPIE
jgi:hypothetical protein